MLNLDFKVSGDITKALNNFEAGITQSILWSGAAAGAKVLYDELKLNTSPEKLHKSEASFVGPTQPTPGQKTKTLHESVYRVGSRSRTTDKIKTYHVGVNKRTARHWHLIEYGHWQPYRAVLTNRGWVSLKNAKHTRKWIPARPYIRPSLNVMPKAIEAAKRRMAQRIATRDWMAEAMRP